jgi:hypothetical protein
MWSKPFTLDFGAAGDDYEQAADKLEDNVDDIYDNLNLTKTTFFGATAPSLPDAGQLWLDSSHTPALLKQYNGSAWLTSFVVYTSATAPSSPSTGQLWLDSTYTPAKLNQYNGSSWVALHESTDFNQGFMGNGKIVVTVASTNLTVAIKTLAGGNPSATDPVYIRIGDTVRSITAALSVTSDAGENTMNLGAAAVAGTHDLFVYLGYNATDGVVLGFARIPYAKKYSDFSTTATDQNYAKISTITNAAAANVYENIGRFDITKQPAAGYEWVITSPQIIIQRPIYESETRIFVPVVTGTSGTLVTSCYYKVVGNLIYYTLQVSCTSNGTSFGLGLPFNPLYVAVYAVKIENNTTVSTTPGQLVMATDGTVAIYTDWAAGGWTNSGTKSIYLPVNILITW